MHKFGKSSSFLTASISKLIKREKTEGKEKPVLYKLSNKNKLKFA